MDPNETLAALRQVLETVETDVCKIRGDEFTVTERNAEKAVDIFQALDEWIKRGGFLPTQWARSKPEQVFEVRVHCDGASLVVGRYYDYAKALAHVALLKGREKEMALLGASGADVVPVEVMP